MMNRFYFCFYLHITIVQHILYIEHIKYEPMISVPSS